ncbi:MAG TPA: glycosyltransferase family 39 protein [Solirubrobacteraceae bacterium]|nr:glycosyltransferase family 39 protein [Solirubrobacteraceae bacterium]
MATAERVPALLGAQLPRRWAWPALGLILAGGLGLRLWGVQQGLPYAYNADEADHFVPRAVAIFGHDLNPHYFANPPGFTYVLHYLFALAYGGTGGVHHAFAYDPTEVYTLSRVAVAVLGVLALWLLYATGARLFGRAAGLLAAAIEAVAFLPVFYSHLALNDVPTLAPLTLSLLGSAGVLCKGRKRDYALAGIGLGLACATKYTAGIALVPLLAAAGARLLGNGEPGRPRIDRATAPAVALGVALTALLAFAAFFAANPFWLLDYKSFHAELVHQSSLSAEAQGKLGAPKQGGFVYYLWSLSWGLGWLPALAALGGALAIWRARPALGWMLVPAPLLFLVFMGLQGRYFGRWLMPILPLLCLLAAFFALWLAGRLPALLGRVPDARRAPLAIGAAAVLAALLLAQGLVYSVHSGLVLARADTRNVTREWMLAHVPLRARIVAEPISPDGWAREHPGAVPATRNRGVWLKYPGLVDRLSPADPSGPLQQRGPQVATENYVRTLSPALVGYYERKGYCWVVSGSTQSGRAYADPHAVPLAIAYYRTLKERGEVVFRSSPYERGAGPVPFGFDWSFDYYPLAYGRPGPSITVYRLHGGRCAA